MANLAIHLEISVPTIILFAESHLVENISKRGRLDGLHDLMENAFYRSA